METFDLIVIGSGPAGEKAAAKAAYFNKKVALIEKSPVFGGAGIQTGTLPSKTLKETAIYLSGVYSKGLFSIDRELSRLAGIKDFMYRKDVVTHDAGEATRQNLLKHGVRIYQGIAAFIDAHTIQISGSEAEQIHGEYILIATGSYPVHPVQIPFDGIRIHDSDTILNLNRFPKSICVLGAGVIGCEYATIFSAMGVKTYIVNNTSKILGFLDQEISTALVAQMDRSGIEVLFNDGVKSIESPILEEDPLLIRLTSGRILEVDMFLFAAGRSGNIQALDCSKAGINTGERETILVNEKYQTNIPNIYAVGDVIGFPALASTSMDQGRVAIAHMFHTNDLLNLSTLFPYGIYTVPEVSMVGITEEKAIELNLDYKTGKCFYADTIRGKIAGAQDHGFLKLVFNRESHAILGVHVIGQLATEIIHYGMCLVKEKQTLDQVIETVFNFPTLHDLYKYAAYDGLGNLTGKRLRYSSEEPENLN